MGLGLLRIILAISVLITHSAYATSLSVPGAVAVKLFFIISGYYMAMILCEKYNTHYRLFFRNRFLRLFPLYITTIILIILLGAATGLAKGNSINNAFYIFYAYQDNYISPTTSLFLIFSNVSMFFQDVLFFLGPNANGNIMWATKEQMANVPFYKYLLIPQAWSLSLEISFYLIAPWIIKQLDRIVIWICVSIILRTMFYIFGCNEEQFVYRFFPAELVFFLMGSLSYHVYLKVQITFITKYIEYLLAVIILMIVLYQRVPENFEIGIRVGLYLAVAFVMPYIFNRSKHNSLDNQLGELSYPFYILHLFAFQVLQVLALRVGINTHGPIFLAAWILSTLILSHAMIRIVQNPFEKIRQHVI